MSDVVPDAARPATNSFDYIVVGAGSAGCVIASRLSARSGNSVLLLEAGQDTPPGNEPADILDTYPASYFNKSYMWPALKAHWRTKENSPAVRYDQARVMGGGSSVMGMVALRGTPDDYNEWEAMGARGWGWRDVLPFFRKLETDADFEGDMHGGDGPIPIRRTPREKWTPLAREAGTFAEEHQLPFIADMNADFRDGYCALPMSNTPGRRASTAICYLDATVRKRKNLTIATSAFVKALIFDKRQAVGVRAMVDGVDLEFLGREIILCAGGIHSPTLLLQAGVGPADHLRDLGIDVRAELPGVGWNLQNHPVLFIGKHLLPAARQPASQRTLQVSCFRLSSHLADCPGTDILVNLQSKSSWNELGKQLANLGPVLWKPMSRGRVSIAAKDSDSPLVEFNFMHDERDLKRMMYGFRFVVDFLAMESVRALGGKAFPVHFTDRLRRLNQASKTNATTTKFAARLFDLLPSLSEKGLAWLTGGGHDLDELVKDNARLAEHIKTNVAGTFHVSGTCRMGAETDRDAVVDAAGRVRKVGGLRVVDASIMPTVPRANTNIPTIMLAEKLADAMLRS